MKAASLDLGGALRALACDLATAEAEIAAFAGAGAPGPRGTDPGEPAISVSRVEMDFPVYLGLDSLTSRPVATVPRRNIVFARPPLLGRVRVTFIRLDNTKSTP